MKKVLSLLATGLMVSALIIGCGTEDPWSPDPTRSLNLSMVSGPADTVGYSSDVSFSWTSTGGEGEVQYQYRLDQGSWSTASNATSQAFEDVTTGFTLGVRATDADGNTDEDSRQFWVGDQPADDTTPPTAEITSSPAEGSFVASGSTISFTWDGSDDADGSNVLFWYSFAGSTSDTSATRTVTFVNVSADPAAAFSVWALDQSGNASTAAAVSFVIKDATILYIDDYQWFDLGGNVDMPTERDQKQFYRDILEGYAFAEWDVAEQGMPDAAALAPFTTILFASDGDGDDGTWWYEVGALGGGPLRTYLETDDSRHLIAICSEILPWIWSTSIPPAPGDFEYDWFGIDSQNAEAIDTTYWLEDLDYSYAISGYDSLTVDTVSFCWDYWDDFTWAVNTGNFSGLPDSMKIDVAKNGDQNGIASNTISLRAGTVVLFTWGLNVDGVRPYAYTYADPIAHLYYVGGQARTAMINFDGYSMPLPSMRQTVGAILTEFGE